MQVDKTKLGILTLPGAARRAVWLLEGRGAEEVTVPLACNLPPEFEYVGSAPRKLGLVLAFVVAGASGIAVFITDSGPDPDPMNAMALAPVEALSSAIPIGRDGPALLSSELATPVAATPDGP